MRKVEIVNRIAEETGLTKVKAEEVVDAILEDAASIRLGFALVSSFETYLDVDAVR